MSYIFNPADNFSLLVFSVFSLLMLLLMLFTLHKSSVSRKVIAGFLTYLAVFFIVIYLKLAQTYFIPIAPLMFLSVFAGSVYLSNSKIGLQIGDTFSFKFLIGVQVFRLPLELILHHWVNIKTIPETMTWTGQNWDIVSGIASLIALPFVNKNRKVVWAAQILGFSLLLNVLRVVVLSSPLPFAWELENPLLLIAYQPYALIGPLFVGVALTFHLIVFRKLLRR